MLLVHTSIRPSRIHGSGLFAAQFIPQGTRVWELAPRYDLIIPKMELSSLPAPVQEQIYHYAYLNADDGYVMCFDDARFCNHSEEPNIHYIDGEIPHEIATRDIQSGEELTLRYSSFDHSWSGTFSFMSHASHEATAVDRQKIAAFLLNTELSRVHPMRHRARNGNGNGNGHK